MSKDSHSFSVSVACEVGVFGAILLQHLCFLQKANVSPGENWQEKWVRRSAASIAKTYPYWSAKQVSAICDNLEKQGYIFSRIQNATKIDRAKSYLLSSKGLHLMGEIPFAQMENGFSKKGNANAQMENDILPNGEMLIKVDYTSSLVPSFVENSAGAFAPLSPPFKKVDEIQPLEAEKENPTPPVPARPPAPTIVKLYDNQLPGVVVVDSIPPQPMTKPETTGREQQKREQKEKEIGLATRVISYLNEKAGRSFRVNADANAKGIIARAREGFTEDEMRTVIDFKVAEWGKDTKFYQYLNPDTLFRPSHFEAYLQAARAAKPKSQQQNTRSQINHFGGESQRYDEKQAF